MDVQSTLELLQRHSRSEEHLRLAALDIGGALGTLEDEALALLDTGLARVQATQPPESAWALGFFSAMSAMLSGLQQQRQHAREQRLLEQELAEEEHALRSDWRRLLTVMGPGLIRPGDLEQATGMGMSQVSRNLSGLVSVGYLERLSVRDVPGGLTQAQDGRARLYRLTPEGLRLQHRLLHVSAPVPKPPPQPASAPQRQDALFVNIRKLLKRGRGTAQYIRCMFHVDKDASARGSERRAPKVVLLRKKSTGGMSYVVENVLPAQGARPRHLAASPGRRLSVAIEYALPESMPSVENARGA